MSAGQVGRLTFALVVCCFPISVRGQVPAGAPLMVALDYDAVPGCPDADHFKAAVAAQLGYDPFDETAADRVLVRIGPHGRVLEGRLEWRDPAGRWVGDKTLPSRSGDCTELARAMAFALTVQIQLLALEREPPGGSAASEAGPPDSPAASDIPPTVASPPVPPPPDAAQDAPEVTQVGRAAEESARPALAVGGGGTIALGLSSGALPLARLFGALSWPGVALELGAEISLPATTRREDGAGFTQQILLATAAGCAGRGRWNACLLAKGGQVRVDGLDIDVPASPSGSVFQAGLRLGALQPIGRRVFLGARVEGVANVTRWTVTLDGLPVWTSPRFAGGLGVDFSLRFP